MKINKQARRDGKTLFRSCLVSGRLDEGRVRTAVDSVLDKKPRGYLAALHHFLRLVKLEVQRRTATVESSMTLEPDLQGQIQDRLASVYGEGLSIRFADNPTLIGGLRVQVGSDVYDSTVRSRLNGLVDAFAAS